MLTIRNVFALLVVCFLAGTARAQDQATGSGVPVRIVVTVEGRKDAAPPSLTRNDVLVYLDNQRMRVTDWTPVQNDRIGLHLWLLIDDGTDTALGTQLEDLRRFVLEQPSSTQVGIGYLRNGTVQVEHKPTADHALAAKAIRLPLGLPGISASPYLALIDLIQKWPSADIGHADAPHVPGPPPPPYVAPMANLTIESNPAGAEVLIDTKPFGATPVTASLRPGSIYIVLKKEGFENWVKELNAQPGPVAVNAEMKKIPESSFVIVVGAK